MKPKLSRWLLGACMAALLAVGIPFWQVPYSKVSLPNTLMAPGLLVVVIGAALARAVGQSRFMTTLWVVGLTVPAVVVARVFVDTSLDPTSHNLWPFEVVIAAFVGWFAAAAGAAIGSVPMLLSRRVSRSNT